MAIGKSQIVMALALVFAALFITRQVTGLKNDRDAALERARHLEHTLHQREAALREQAQAAARLQATAAAGELVLLGWSALRQHTQAAYDAQEEESRKALTRDQEYARWSTALLPVRLHPGSGLLGRATTPDRDPAGSRPAPGRAVTGDPGS